MPNGIDFITFTFLIFIAGILLGYLTGTTRKKKMHRRILELEQDMLRRDAEQLRKEAFINSPAAFKEAKPIK